MRAGFQARTETPRQDARSRSAPVSSSPAPTGSVDVDVVRSLQRTAGNAAVSALLSRQRSPTLPSRPPRARPGGRSATVQRNEESAVLLKELAEPKVLEFDAGQVDVQKDIVNGLESEIARNKAEERTLKLREEDIDTRAEASVVKFQEYGDTHPEFESHYEVLMDPDKSSGLQMTPGIEESKKVIEEFERGTKATKKERKQLSKDTTTQKDRSGRWDDAVIVLGAIELDSLPDNDPELLNKATLTALDTNSLNKQGAFDLVEHAGMKANVVQNTLNTMIKAGQIDYLRKSGIIGPDYKVVIEIHYYRSRSKDVSQFHKDTLGQTLFVNLNYHIDHELAGPEYLLHPPTVPEHERQISGPEGLPPEFLKDLTAARHGTQEPTEIGAPIIPAYGAVAFVDELIHHMTPHYGHRKVTGANFAKYLESKSRDEFKHGKERWEEWLDMSRKSATEYTRPDFDKAGMSEEEIDRLLTEHGGSGFQTVSIPGVPKIKVSDTETKLPSIERSSKVPLKRRMSQRALKPSGEHGSLPPEVTGERRFFRTWVRAVRKTGGQSIQ